MDMAGWIILSSAIVYLLGILGTLQILVNFVGESCMGIYQFYFGAILWPVIMPVAGLAWLLGIEYWIRRKGN